MGKESILKFTKGKLYILLSLILWIIVDYITVWNSRLEEWLGLMPWIIIQYLFIVLIFWFFLFIVKLRERWVFLIMLGVMYGFEILWQNFLLFNLVWVVPASLLLISIWGFLTFLPFWIVNKMVRKRKLLTVLFLLWILVAGVMALMNFLG